MSNSVEADNLKRIKRKKIGKIAAVIAAVLLVGWSIYCIATNLNQKETKIFNAFVEVYFEKEQPSANRLLDCSRIYKAPNSKGKIVQYVIAEIETQPQQSQCYLLVISGKDQVRLFIPETLYRLDINDKDKIRFEITERDEQIDIAKIQSTLTRYWRFRDLD